MVYLTTLEQLKSMDAYIRWETPTQKPRALKIKKLKMIVIACSDVNLHVGPIVIVAPTPLYKLRALHC